MKLKHTTIIAVILIALFACNVAYADEPTSGTRRHEPIQPVDERSEAEQQPAHSVINKYDGVNEYAGRTETWYSSNVLYHYRTSEWTADSEGFYRTDEGYYVVAASDLPEGTIFETSKGTAIVLDCGCDAGITDFYVNWD